MNEVNGKEEGGEGRMGRHFQGGGATLTFGAVFQLVAAVGFCLQTESGTGAEEEEEEEEEAEEEAEPQDECCEENKK